MAGTAYAEQLIEALGLARHPEGGWYRETWRSALLIGERAAGTSIYFLLEDGQESAWHQVDADEFWLWHAGSSLELRIADQSAESSRRVVLGPDIVAGENPQVLIRAGEWQCARAVNGWALLSCLVVPGFEFSGFRLAPPELAARLGNAGR